MSEKWPMIKDDNNKAKGQDGFKDQHVTIDFLVTFRVIVEDCRDTNMTSFVVLLILEKHFTLSLKLSYEKFGASKYLP